MLRIKSTTYIKYRKRQSCPMRLVSSVVDLPLRGQDAYAISDSMLVVADGVGSWDDRGVNAGIWSHMLVSEIILSDPDIPDTETLLEILRHSVARTRAPGTSTLTLLAMDPSTGTAIAYNLGDSVWWHIRDGRVINRSRLTVHGHDVPYQIGRNPDMSLANDSIEDGITTRLRLRTDDYLVLASDGITKLLDDTDLVDMLSDEEPALAALLLSEVIEDIGIEDDTTVIISRIYE